MRLDILSYLNEHLAYFKNNETAQHAVRIMLPVEVEREILEIKSNTIKFKHKEQEKEKRLRLYPDNGNHKEAIEILVSIHDEKQNTDYTCSEIISVDENGQVSYSYLQYQHTEKGICQTLVSADLNVIYNQEVLFNNLQMKMQVYDINTLLMSDSISDQALGMSKGIENWEEDSFDFCAIENRIKTKKLNYLVPDYFRDLSLTTCADNSKSVVKIIKNNYEKKSSSFNIVPDSSFNIVPVFKTSLLHMWNHIFKSYREDPSFVDIANQYIESDSDIPCLFNAFSFSTYVCGKLKNQKTGPIKTKNRE